MKILGYRVEGTTLCKGCTKKHIDYHFPEANQERIVDYLDEMTYPLKDSDISEYGNEVLKEVCEKCEEKIYSLV